MSMGASNTDHPAAGWARVGFAEAGFGDDVGVRLDTGFATGALEGLHAVVVARHGKLVCERYYAGADECWGRPLGVVEHGPDRLHDLRSVSKSVVGLLYGIALEEGLVPTLDQPLVESFPQYGELAADPQRQRITVGDALTMSMGLEWSEDLPYSDPRNSEIAMEMAPDRYRYVLERPVAEAPGQRFVYTGGATALVARLIELGAAMPLHAFAKERLLAPLGIETFEWMTGEDGRDAAASGLRLAPRDLARLGVAVLAGGAWNGRRLVPQTWLAASFEPRLQTEGGPHYGYHWWLGTSPSGKPWVAAFGNGGQRLMLVPHLDMAIAVLAGRYNQMDAWRLPVAVITQCVFASFRGP
jgi:CubicO group peptidase (beta-lactamase class C family)